MEEKDTKISREEALKLLESSYDMYQTTREETIDKRRHKTDKDGNRIYSENSLTETLELMDTMVEDVIKQYAELGGDVEKLKSRKVKKRNDRGIKDSVERISAQDGMSEYRKAAFNEAKERAKNKYAPDTVAEDKVTEDKTAEKGRNPEDVKENNRKILEKINIENVKKDSPEKNPFRTDETRPMPEPQKVNTQKTSFDEVSLPSRGECYRQKMDRIKVSHLVAYDENLILSPGLYRNGTFLDHILRNKILDNIDPDDLIQGDRDAIIIWLRAGGYGPMYPVKITDEETGQDFESEVDLSQLNFRPFNLHGDENGYFDYVLPNSGDAVKFRFLTAGDAKRLEKMRESENESENATLMRDKIRDLVDFLENSEKIGKKESDGMVNDLKDMESVIYERYKDVGETYYTHDLTNRLVMSTVSINGITDRNYIANYVLNMNLKDAADYRKYIVDNEPGIDYNIKVKRPDSLGGGYVETFLQLDQFIFIY
jgi:hypothetical protein